MTVGEHGPKPRTLELREDRVDDQQVQSQGNPVAASVELPRRGGGVGVVHSHEHLPVVVGPCPVRSEVDRRHDNPAELPRALDHESFGLQRVGAQREVFPVPFQGAQGEIGNRPFGESAAEFVRQQLVVTDLRCRGRLFPGSGRPWAAAWRSANNPADAPVRLAARKFQTADRPSKLDMGRAPLKSVLTDWSFDVCGTGPSVLMPIAEFFALNAG